ncbi:MAG: hypothetical protein KF744_07985 [Taibaiella sp.]|nr:hypothetical protein [Taibaiella sp.]
MKYAVLVVLCFFFSLAANGAAVTVHHLHPVVANVADSTAIQTVEKPNYKKGKIRIVRGIITAALAGVCFYSTVSIILTLGTIMLVVGGAFILAGILSLIDQSVRYKQRKQQQRKAPIHKVKDKE